MRNFVKFERNIKLTVTLLDSLEFVVHPNNLNICPCQISWIPWFCIIDSRSMIIYLSKKKKVCIKQLFHKVLQEEFLIIRKIARQLGNLQAVFLHCVLAHCMTGDWNEIKFSHSNLPKEVLTKRWKFPRLGKWTFYGW